MLPAVSPPTLTGYFAGRGLPLAGVPGSGTVCLRFTDPGDEYRATRRDAGLFDFSFMGWWSISGRGAFDFLQHLQTRDLARLAPGRLAYSLLCRDDGTVLNDATVWCLDRGRYWLFTGRRTDHHHILRVARRYDVDVVDESPRHSILALQGPSSAARLERLFPGSTSGLRRFGFGPLDHDARGSAGAAHAAGMGRGWIGRLGYTGELGFELLVPADLAAGLWEHLADPASSNVRECGMEAANILRIEAGFIHFAYELLAPRRPVELRLARLVDWRAKGFLGREALLSGAAPGPRLVGVVPDQPARAPVCVPPGHRVVEITSQAYSPAAQRTLGLGFVGGDVELGDVVYTAGGHRGRVTRLPFRVSKA